MIYRREYIFGKLNWNDNRHREKMEKSVKKATKLGIGVSFKVTDRVIEFVDVNDKIKFEPGKLSFILSTKVPAKDEITINRKYDKFVKYVREIFHRVPTLTGKIDEQEYQTTFAKMDSVGKA